MNSPPRLIWNGTRRYVPQVLRREQYVLASGITSAIVGALQVDPAVWSRTVYSPPSSTAGLACRSLPGIWAKRSVVQTQEFSKMLCSPPATNATTPI
eukprot:6109773-Pyramimonas_sp.AAC.2